MRRSSRSEIAQYMSIARLGLNQARRMVAKHRDYAACRGAVISFGRASELVGKVYELAGDRPRVLRSRAASTAEYIAKRCSRK